MSWIMIMYKNGQKICTTINFDHETGNFAVNEPNNIKEDEESLDNNRSVAATENSEMGDDAMEADLKKGTTATSVYLRDNLEEKGIIEILSLLRKEWFSAKDVDLSLSRLKGPFIIVFFFWLLR